MTNRPHVSVILAAFNSESFVGQAVASVLQQTVSDLELLVIDDGSTDRTVDLVRAFDDPRIRLFAQPVNRGPSHARNVGLTEARGEWITIIDSDDWYAPDRLEQLLDVAKNGADLIGDNFFRIRDGASKPWTTQFEIAGFDMGTARSMGIVEYVLESCPGRAGLRPGIMKPLMRADFMGRHRLRFDENIWIGEDFLLYYSCLLVGARFILVPQALYYRRERTGSLVRRDSPFRFDQLERVNTRLLAATAVRQQPELHGALLQRARAIAETESVGRVAEYVRSMRFSRALGVLLHRPRVLVSFVFVLWWKGREAARRGIRGRLGRLADLASRSGRCD